MGRLQTGTVAAVVAVAVLLAAAAGSWAQAPLSARLHPSGMIQVVRGDVELAAIELNAHGPDWKYGPQAGGEAQVSDEPEQGGKRFVGTFPVPNTEGGSIKFAETVTPLPQGLKLAYDVGVTKDMKLNGLQVSVLLPTAQYGGREVLITHPDADPQGATLPKEQQENFYVWGGEGAKVEVARATPDAVTVELQAPADIVIHDLRQWERPTFEIRFPAIMEGEARDVAADDWLHLDLVVTFAEPIKLEGP